MSKTRWPLMDVSVLEDAGISVKEVKYQEWESWCMWNTARVIAVTVETSATAQTSLQKNPDDLPGYTKRSQAQRIKLLNQTSSNSAHHQTIKPRDQRVKLPAEAEKPGTSDSTEIKRGSEEYILLFLLIRPGSELQRNRVKLNRDVNVWMCPWHQSKPKPNAGQNNNISYYCIPF